MKKIFAFSVLALTVLACNKEIAEQQIVPADEQLTTISATAEDLTKVALDMSAEVNLTWVDTDDITVYDGTNSSVFTIKSCTGASAVFEGSCNTSASMLYAVYPSGAFSSAATDAIKVTVPKEQIIPDGGCVDPKALVAVGYAAPGQPMAFKQVCGLLKITVPEAETHINEITILGTGLSGTATANADGTLVYSDAVLENVITVSNAGGVFTPGDYYVAVMPGITPAGTFTISYSTTLGESGAKTASSVVTFERAKGLNAGSMTGFTKSIVIKTMPELYTWNANRDTKDVWNVIIGADIDMESEPWTPKDFKGTFDGQGHKLYNLNVNRPSNACFINTLDGTMKDVIFGSSNGTTYDGTSAIVQDNPEDAGTDWRYAGLVTRLTADASMTGVVSYIPVTVAATSTSKTRVGGLVGIVADKATAVSVSNCENHGDISILAASPALAGSVGGLIGWTDASFNCLSSSNYGDITVANAYVEYAAGILSTDEVGGTFDGCVNKGNISFTASGTCAMCVGGILGNATSSSVLNCKNYGSISSVLDGELKVGGIVGRAYTNGIIDNCVNYEQGTITFNPSTTSKQAFIGGIVGNAPAANEGTLSVSNCTNYASLTSDHINVANIAGIAGMINMTSGTLNITDCDNYGDITRNVSETTKGANTDVSVAGILAYARVLAGSKVSSCTNHGKIQTNTNNTSTVIRIGGVVAYSYQNLKIDSCVNEGMVKYDNSATAVGSTIHIAGIIGHPMRNTIITDCENSGSIYANRLQVNRVGGIAGTLNNSSLSGCTNSGSVTLEISTAVTFWEAVGGIVGFAEGSGSTAKDLINNENTGTVSLLVNATHSYARCCAGGIVGMPYTAFNVTGNINSGTVNGNNAHASAPYCYVGGIIGQDSGAGNVSTISGNKSYGEVNNLTGNASYSAAGGLIGNAGKAAISGSVFCAVSGTNAGAVAGVNSKAITATLCDAVTVNGVTKANAANEAAWLCPSNTGTITPTYVAHSDSE